MVGKLAMATPEVLIYNLGTLTRTQKEPCIHSHITNLPFLPLRANQN